MSLQVLRRCAAWRWPSRPPARTWAAACRPMVPRTPCTQPKLQNLLLLVMFVRYAGAQALRCLALAYKPASKDMGSSLPTHAASNPKFTTQTSHPPTTVFPVPVLQLHRCCAASTTCSKLAACIVCAFAGAQALRCLALAYKPASKHMGSSLSPLDEAGLTFVAMVAMHDPPRRCVKKQVVFSVQKGRTMGLYAY